MPTLNIPNVDSLDILLDQKLGFFENIFFANADDWSKVLFFFNGAITKEKKDLDFDSAIFQRWSWHTQFRHPMFCIADPLTYGEGAIPLAWYQGDSSQIYLENIFSVIQASLLSKRRSFKTLAFGSSGGGFAALLCAQLGLVDSVIAVNPQTDIMKFWEKSALNSFLEMRKVLSLDSFFNNYSLLDVGFSDMRSSCKVTYVQNLCDENHYSEHMIPYVSALLKSKSVHSFDLICFNNPALGHNPPDFLMLSEMVGSSFTSLVK